MKLRTLASTVALALLGCGDATLGDSGGPAIDAATATDSALSSSDGDEPNDSSNQPTPPPVTACGGSVGVWQNITPQVFAGDNVFVVTTDPVNHIVYSSANIATSQSTGIYSSTDCGASWKLASTGLGESQLAGGDPWAMMIAPVTAGVPSTMYLSNGYGSAGTNALSIFKSTDSGVDWTPLTPDPTGVTQNFVQAISMDPQNAQHIAITFHENCGAPFTPMCLSVSTDGGTKWTLMNGPPASEVKGWVEDTSLTVVSADTYILNVPFVAVYFFNGTSWTQKVPSGPSSFYSGGAHIASNGTIFVGTDSGSMYQSTDHGNNWTSIANSPYTIGTIIDDGVSLYVSNAFDTSGQPLWSAPLNNVTSWTHVVTPTIPNGATQFAYDPGQNAIYAATLNGGLWRLITQ